MVTKIYTFIPDPILFPCALKTNSLSISIGPIEPDFTGFSICSGDPTSSLSNVSTNGITGIWSPTDIVDSSVLGVGTFPFTFIPDAGQACITPTDIKTINVIVNPSNTILSLNWTVTEAFSKNQIVTVTDPLGSNYLYQMDFGPFQTSPVFENVASGLHSISVKHVNGCSEFTENNVLIIGYPKFFTPNGDGYNDTWNIPGLKDQLNSRIHIFDRYGKLLKDISPNDPGWDGTYIGQPMPADDYWFNVEYIENAVLKKFKSHFSLKR
jgi:gliding motility-associated-like protein